MTILKGFTQKISIYPKLQKEQKFEFFSKLWNYFEKIKNGVVKYDHSSPFCISRMILKHLVRQKKITKNRNLKIMYCGHFKGIYTENQYIPKITKGIKISIFFKIIDLF